MINLILGDCFDEMQKLDEQSFDLIFSDPPYGMTNLDWDGKLDLQKLWQMYGRLLKNSGKVILFSSGLFTIYLVNSNKKDFKYRLIWEKNVPTGMSSAKYRPMKYFEEICVFYKTNGTYNPIMKERVGKHKECYNYDHYCGESNHVRYEKQKKRYDPDYVLPSDILHFDVVPNRKGKLHPTQKPLELCKYIIKTYTNEGDRVLDSFMGSGTVGLACKELGRNFVGIEKDENYFSIAKERI